MKLTFFTLLFLLLLSFTTFAANFFWIGGSGPNNWNNAANWSATSGGAVGAGIPGTADVATFDNNSGVICNVLIPSRVGGVNILSTYTGTISLSDSLIITGNSGYTQAGGTFNCNNAIFICSNVSNFTRTGGTLIYSSRQTFLGGNVSFFSSGFNANGGEIVLTSTNNINININGTGTPGTIVFNNLTIGVSGGSGNVNYTLNGTGNVFMVQGNLNIIQGALLSSNTTNKVQLMGNLTVNTTGTTPSTVNIDFIGATNQTIQPAKSDSALFDGNITINKASAKNTVTLLNPILLNSNGQTLTFTKGVIVTSSTNVLRIVPNNVTVTGANDSSYVDGPMATSGNQGFTFPVGNNGVYAPISVSNSGTTVGGDVHGAFQAQYFRANPNTQFPIGSRDTSLHSIGKCEYWILNSLTAGTSAFVWLSYTSLRSCGITVPASLRVAQWNGTRWINDGGALVTSGSTFVRTESVLSTFSPFDLSSVDSTANPLPIQLTAFKAKYQEGYVALNWETANEVNNDHFVLERSSDGNQFNALTSIKGAGNSTIPHTYSYNDNSTISGNYYYRLKMLAFDGSSSYSNTIAVQIGANETELTVFPNPASSGEKISLMLPALKEKSMEIKLSGVDGRMITTSSITFDANGLAELNLSTPLIPGFYFIEMNGEGNRYRARMTVK